MALQSDINKFLEKHPGSMAKEIVVSLGTTRNEINSFLYSNKADYERDSSYHWSLKNSPFYTDKVLRKLSNVSGAKNI